MPVPTRLRFLDGRRLDVFLAGPPAGTPLLFHHGTPGAGIPFTPFVQALGERGLRYVDSLPQILDDLMATGR